MTIAPANRSLIWDITGYIYLTENTINGHKYIGQHHWEKPGIDSKYYGSGLNLNRAIEKYGKENFVVHILQWCKTKWDANARENAWILMYDAVHSPEFYNMSPGGDGGAIMLGRKHTEETKQKMLQNSNRHTVPVKDVLEIVRMCNEEGLSRTQVSKMYPVTPSQIGRICNGKSWSIVTGIKEHSSERNNKILSLANSKLTENQVMEIVELKKQGLHYTEIAQKFGVTPQTISNICRGKSLSSITGIQPKKKMSKPKLTETQILEIVSLREQGFLLREIAQKFGAPIYTISKICRGKSYSLITRHNL